MNIILIYQIFAQPQKEIYLGEWTILSLEQALEIYKSYCNEGQKNVFDIGYRYIGMGHIVVCSYDPSDGKIFFRRDGGSNGYERFDRWNFIKSYKPEVKKKHNISMWLNKVEEEYNSEKYKEQPWLYFDDPLLINP